MSTLDILLSDIQPDPKNARKTFHNLKELAKSIGQWGLFQNLVVRPAGDGTYILIAGERRFRAMKMLQEGLVPGFSLPDNLRLGVPCIIFHAMNAGDDVLAQLTENVQRDGLFPWESGRRCAELVESGGLTLKEISERMYISQGSISTDIKLFRYLAPEVISELSALPLPSIPPKSFLLELTDLRTDESEPDSVAQLKKLHKRLELPPPKRGPALGIKQPVRTVIWNRYRELRAGKFPNAITPRQQEFVNAVLEFLSGRESQIVFPTKEKEK